MNEKKIEPTKAMVTDTLEAKYQLNLTSVRSILRVGLNHPDAAGLLAAEWKANAEAAAERAERAEEALAERERTNTPDDRPWEPLNKHDPLHVGDEVRQDLSGITHTAVVGCVDGEGDPWATGGNFIGRIDFGTWYVRRHIQELPTEPDAVIERADGHKYITATVDGETYRAREAILIGKDDWHAAWRSDAGVQVYVTPEQITPGTWKVDDK